METITFIVCFRPSVIVLSRSSEGAKKEIVAGFSVPLTLNILRWSCKLKQ